MKCGNCKAASDGYAVIPGIGETGEARFYCDRCARNHRVKMRYWDGRDLDVGGWREKPDLGDSFQTLIFGFADIARMRIQDLAPVMDWVEDEEVALALVGAPSAVKQRIFAAMLPLRVAEIERMLARGNLKGTAAAPDGAAAQALFISLIKRL